MSSGSGASSVEVRPLVTTAMVVVAVIFPILSFLAVLLRFMARKKAGLKIGPDDWLTVVAWIPTFALSVIPWIFGSKTGVDSFKVDPIVGITLSVMCIWVTSIFLALCLPIIKISIILFYKRIFSVKWFQITALTSIVAITIWGTIFFFIIIFQGHPISVAYTGIGKLSISPTALGLTQASTSFIIDLFVLSLPIPVIYQLHLPLKQKIAVAGIFGLGGFCVIAAATRLALLVRSLRIVQNSKNAGFAAVDTETTAFMFIIVEPNCSIIASCLPCFGPLVLGMRAPESLIRSVRSMISLRSGRSDGSQQRTTKGSPFQQSTPKATTFVPGKPSNSNLSSSETAQDEEIELRKSSATSTSHTRLFPAQVVSEGPNQATSSANGINVTKTIEVHEQGRRQ